jgi:hypothetical protein
VVGSLPFFVGLAVVMPVLAHSTWHLYRKVVESDLSPRPDLGPLPDRRPGGRRYAADFPFSFPGPTRKMSDKKRNLGGLAASVRNPAAELHRHRRWI